MPFSIKVGKPAILKWFIENKNSIHKVIDIGVGCGTYSTLVRNICNTAEWVGIEVYEPYIEEFKLKEKYDVIINEDARTLDYQSLGKFDVAIAGDVLEHMTKEEAVILVDKLLEIANTLIISIPQWYSPQGESYGNVHEIHIKDDWSESEVIETWGDNIFHKYECAVNERPMGVYWLKK